MERSFTVRARCSCSLPRNHVVDVVDCLGSLGWRSIMGQVIKRKGVVTGKAAEKIRRALANAKPDPKKAKKLEEALEFHRSVKFIE